MAYEPNDSLEKLKENLDSRMHEQKFSDVRTELERPEIAVENAWSGDSVEDLVRRTREQREHVQSTLFKKILFSSIGFFVLAVAVALYIFFVGANTVSSNNIDIVISGPTSVSGGQELPLEVIVQNKNSTDLEGATLSLEYPQGTRVAGDITKELIHQREIVGIVPARGEARKTMKSVLFGEKETVKTIKVTLEYRVQGSSATFSKEKNYDIGISSAPIIVTPKYPTRIKANEPFSFTLDIASNTTELLQNVLVQAEYPFGFTFTSSEPKPLNDTNIWRLGDLGSSEHRTIQIKGVLQGQDQDERTFRFSAGIAGEDNDSVIGANLTALAETVKIEKPVVTFQVNIAGEKSSDYTAGVGEKFPVIITWRNNLSTRIINAQIKVKISGAAFDRNAIITSNGGFYRSIDNTITWDKNTNVDLSEIAPGDTGSVSFSMSTLKNLTAASRNENVTVAAVFDGSQLSPDNIPIAVNTSATQQVKLGSVLAFTSKGGRSIGPFENTGPMPPKAEQETTYTVIWTLTNTLNNANNVKVTTTLPPYVNWNSLTSPSSEKITYDSLNRMVTWDVGTVRGGAGFGSAAREVSFQIAFTPSLNQVRRAPILVNEANLTGIDSFTGKSIQITRPEITTKINNDPDFKPNDDEVVK